jgi:hypothetical protein
VTTPPTARARAWVNAERHPSFDKGDLTVAAGFARGSMELLERAFAIDAGAFLDVR